MNKDRSGAVQCVLLTQYPVFIVLNFIRGNNNCSLNESSLHMCSFVLLSVTLWRGALRSSHVFGCISLQ